MNAGQGIYWRLVVSCLLLAALYPIKNVFSGSSEITSYSISVLYFVVCVNTLYLLVTAIAVATAGKKTR